MEEKSNNENYLKFKQNSKGEWYCDGFAVYGDDLNADMEVAEKWIDYINEVLKVKNVIITKVK